MAASPKIICIGLNYHDHALEQGAELPKEPLLFGKFASALIGPDEAIVLPPESAHVDLGGPPEGRVGGKDGFPTPPLDLQVPPSPRAKRMIADREPVSTAAGADKEASS